MVLRGDENARPGSDLDQSLVLEGAIRAPDGAVVGPQLVGERADAGEPVVGIQASGVEIAEDATAQMVGDLFGSRQSGAPLFPVEGTKGTTSSVAESRV